VEGLTRDFQEFLSLLVKHEVRFLVTGGFALAAHGHPRYTKDIDLWIEPAPENATRVLAALDEFGFASLGLTAADFVTTDHVIQLGHEPSRIDLLTGVSGLTFAEAYATRVHAVFGGVAIPVLGRAALIANKRATGRPQDVADIAALEEGDDA
jgi:hypothetical protein